MPTVRLASLALLVLLIACSPQPTRRTAAVIVDISPASHGRWNTDQLLVTARSPEGLVGTKTVSITELRCHVGDTVTATARGVALELDDRACR